MKHILTITTLLVIYAFCVSAQEPSDSLIIYNERLQNYIHAGFMFKLGKTREELYQNLGRPDSIAVETTNNCHVENVVDTIFTYNYSGITVQTYKGKYVNGGTLLTKVIVTDSLYKNIYDLNVGSSENEIFSVFGPPKKYKNNSIYLYEVIIGAPDGLLFYIEKGEIIKIIRNYYND